MALSHSFGNQVSRFSLAVAGAKSNAADLPKEAVKAAATLELTVAELTVLNAEQKKARVTLATTTKKITAGLKVGRTARAKIVSFAEGSFGKTDERMTQFRPEREGHIVHRKPKAEKTAK